MPISTTDLALLCAAGRPYPLQQTNNALQTLERAGVIVRHAAIVTGASRPANRRPMELAWAESAVQQCEAAGVACFVKQLEVDGRVTGDIGYFPERLQVRQWPKGGAS